MKNAGLQFKRIIYRYLWVVGLLAVNFLAHSQELNAENLAFMHQPPTMYSGFASLLDDDKTLIEEQLLDIDKKIKRIAFYYTGDRLHRQIPKQVHLMIENKIMGKFMSMGRYEVVDCIECRTTKVDIDENMLTIHQAAEDNQSLRELSKAVRADAFILWNASVHEDKFTINMRMVNSTNNEVLWIKEYSKVTTREDEDNGFESTNLELVVGTWGVGGTRRNITGGSDAELTSVTAIGLRRRETTTLHKDIEYTLGIEYFKNYALTDQFNVSGINLEGRIIVGIEAMKGVVDTRAYLGIGQAFFSGAHSLIFRFGFEFPFVTNGFMDLGMVYMSSEEVEWTQNSDYEDASPFGGAGLDLTLGYRF